MKANIWIDKKGNTLRLRWNYEGKRCQLSLGVRDDYAGQLLANAKKTEIERDIFSGHYDQTLLKYKLRKFGTNASEITAVALFEKYTAAIVRDKDLAPGSLHRYKAIASKLRECLGDKLAHQVNDSIARNAVSVMTETLSGQTVKTYLFLIRACWDWAKGKYHLADSKLYLLCPQPIGQRLSLRKYPQVQPNNWNLDTRVINQFYPHPPILKPMAMSGLTHPTIPRSLNYPKRRSISGWN